jgi:signal transduction histidine kinase
MKIGLKLIVISEMLVLLTITSVGYVSSQIGNQTINERIESQLGSVAILKAGHLQNFIKEKTENIISLCNQYQHFSQQMHYTTQYIREFLEVRLTENSFFTELFVMDTDGTILLSTDISQEGKVKSNEEYFKQGKSTTFVQSFYYDLTLQQPAITITTPVKDENNTTVQVFAGKVNLSEISGIMLERTGLGETGETYLVNNFNYIVTPLKTEETMPLKRAVYTEIIKKGLKEKPVTAQILSDYSNYADIPSIGAYVYLPELNVCLIAEMSQAEASAPLTLLRNDILVISFVIFCISLVLGFFIAQTIAKPVKKLTEITETISGGNLGVPVDIATKDEVGQLAASFEKMRLSLKTTNEELVGTQKNLEKKVEERTIELNEKMKKLQDSEVATLNIMEDLRETMVQLQNSKEKIERQNVQLKKLDKIKSDFLNVTSHELRTPMSAIKGYVQMVLKQTLGGITEEQKKVLDIVLRNTNRLDNLIQDILDVSRLESGTMKFIPQPTDLGNMIDEAVETMQSYADVKDIKINSDINTLLPELVIDGERVKQVLINIINNAIKFSPDRSIITIRATKEEQDVLFEIEDTGRGIPKEKQNKIFDTFYQVDGGMDRKFGGAGLGLAIARGIVLSHGGDIWVESSGTPGEGTTFKFTLPLIPVHDLEGKFREVDIFRLKDTKKSIENDLRSKTVI